MSQNQCRYQYSISNDNNNLNHMTENSSCSSLPSPVYSFKSKFLHGKDRPIKDEISGIRPRFMSCKLEYIHPKGQVDDLEFGQQSCSDKKLKEVVDICMDGQEPDNSCKIRKDSIGECISVSSPMISTHSTKSSQGSTKSQKSSTVKHAP